MATTNPITGDTIATRTITDNYRNNYDLIWGKKKNDTTTTDHPAQDTSDSATKPEDIPQTLDGRA